MGREKFGSPKENTNHEVTLLEVKLASKTLLTDISHGPVDLVIIVVETGDVNVSESDDLAGGTTDSTTDVKNLHTGPKAHHMSEVVLMTGEGLAEWLAGVEATEMEGLAPAIFIKIG